jgi:protein-tyrosine phosphatase
MASATVFPVAGPWTGRLGIVPRPRGGDWLGDDAKAWRDAGINMVVSLLEPTEAADLDLAREAQTVAALGLMFQAFPIPDRGVPASRDSVAQLTRRMIEVLRTGASVVVHCRQGIGRSSMIVAAALVSHGVSVTDALAAIKKSRGIEVPETDEQRRWLADFASWFEAASAVRKT